jgi:hypothetical protein
MLGYLEAERPAATDHVFLTARPPIHPIHTSGLRDVVCRAIGRAGVRSPARASSAPHLRVGRAAPPARRGLPAPGHLELFNPDHVEVKQKLARALNAFLEPLRERRIHYEAHLDDVRDILRDGTRRANEIANRHMDAILRHMGLFKP